VRKNIRKEKIIHIVIIVIKYAAYFLLFLSKIAEIIKALEDFLGVGVEVHGFGT